MSNATQLNSKKTTSKWTYLQQIMRWHFLWKRQRKISTVHKRKLHPCRISNQEAARAQLASSSLTVGTAMFMPAKISHH